MRQDKFLGGKKILYKYREKEGLNNMISFLNSSFINVAEFFGFYE